MLIREGYLAKNLQSLKRTQRARQIAIRSYHKRRVAMAVCYIMTFAQ